MKTKILYKILVSLILLSACGKITTKNDHSGSTSTHQQAPARDEIAARKTCASLTSEQHCEKSKDICYYNKINSTCASKADLAVAMVAATKDALFAITKDGYLFENPITGAPHISLKAKGLSSTNDYYCIIDEIDELSCKGNMPTIPPHTKAKQVSVGSKDSLCYLTEQDKIACLGANAPDPQNGGFYNVNLSNNTFAIIPQDYSNKTFTSIMSGPDHVCGKTNTEILCMNNGPIPATVANARFLENKTYSSDRFALGFRTTYHYYGNEGVGFSSNNASAFTDTTKFIAQGTKSSFVDVSQMNIFDMSVFMDGTSENICLLSDKVYCTAIDPQELNAIDLAKFKPKNVKKIFLTSNIICGIDSADKLHCAQMFGNQDNRVLGFVSP